MACCCCCREDDDELSYDVSVIIIVVAVGAVVVVEVVVVVGCWNLTGGGYTKEAESNANRMVGVSTDSRKRAMLTQGNHNPDEGLVEALLLPLPWPGRRGGLFLPVRIGSSWSTASSSLASSSSR